MLIVVVLTLMLWSFGLLVRDTGSLLMGIGVFLGGYLVYVQKAADHSKVSGLVPLVRRYADEIKNGREPEDIYAHYLSEHEELKTEWENGSLGVDGVMGESIDIICCLLDLIIVSYPEMTDKQIMAFAVKKLDKWKAIYSGSVHGIRPPG